MEDILEFKTTQRTIGVNPELNKYEGKVIFSEKLKKARETLERCPPPAQLLLKRYSKIEQEEGIYVSGVLKRADGMTFLVVKTKGIYDIHYHIRTTPETLAKILKAYWEEPINVHIRPQINADNQFEYELIEVKVN